MLAGAGASAQGIADLFVAALRDEGLSLEDARRRICTVDSRGLVTADRPGLEPFKATYARPAGGGGRLRRARDPSAHLARRDDPQLQADDPDRHLRHARPVHRGGRAGDGGDRRAADRVSAVEPDQQERVHRGQAVRWSDGRAIVATGSPFAPVAYGGRGIASGRATTRSSFPASAWDSGSAACAASPTGCFSTRRGRWRSQVTPGDLGRGAVYPELTRIRDCSHAVACAVIRRAIVEGQSALPRGAVVEDLVTEAMWLPEYREIRYEPRVELAAVR